MVGQTELMELPATALLKKNLDSIEPHLPIQLSKFVHSLVARIEAFERRIGSVPFFVSLQKSTGMPGLALAILLAAVTALAVRKAMKSNALLVSNLFGAVYPGLRSIKAVENPQQDDDERWLTYWTAFGAFSITDQFAANIQRVFPLYFSTKMAFLYWMFKQNGSLVIYRKVARPLLIKYGNLCASSSSSTPTTAASHSRETSTKAVEPYSVNRVF